MVILIVSILVGILGVVFAVVSYPLFKDSVEAGQVLPEKQGNRAEYNKILARIRELEQEHADDKLSEEDYLARRDSLNLEAIDCLREIESNLD